MYLGFQFANLNEFTSKQTAIEQKSRVFPFNDMKICEVLIFNENTELLEYIPQQNQNKQFSLSSEENYIIIFGWRQ